MNFFNESIHMNIWNAVIILQYTMKIETHVRSIHSQCRIFKTKSFVNDEIKKIENHKTQKF